MPEMIDDGDAVNDAMLGVPEQPPTDDADDDDEEAGAPSVLILAVKVGPNNVPFAARKRH